MIVPLSKEVALLKLEWWSTLYNWSGICNCFLACCWIHFIPEGFTTAKWV